MKEVSQDFAYCSFWYISIKGIILLAEVEEELDREVEEGEDLMEEEDLDNEEHE